MASLRVLFAAVVLVATFGLTPASAGAQSSASGAKVVEDPSVIVDPSATVAGTPTPSPTASPIETVTPGPGETATPTPTPTRQEYIAPGYGNAAQQSEALKKREHTAVCESARRPPTSHMLGTIGVVPGNASPNWVPLVIAISLGAALFAVVAFALRKRGADGERPGALEGIATLVAICGSLAGLAGQFIPGATIKEKPAREATLVVRDVKPRITRAEYARKVGVDVSGAGKLDRTEVGDVVWLEIVLKGFKGEPLRVQYGLFDPDANETLLPGTGKQVRLRAPGSEAETIFLPIWVGFPRSVRFTAEFRLVDQQGRVQQMAATDRMRGSRFRYACERRT